MKKKSFYLLVVFILLTVAACGNKPAETPVSPLPAVTDPETQPEDTEPMTDAEEDKEKDHQEIHALLSKGLDIQNISYTAKFNSSNNEFIYEYYKRDHLVKMVTQEGDSQSVSICDGQSTVYYSLPEKIGYRMMEAGDDMGLVPNTEALLNEQVYRFKTVGEEVLAGLSCQVVETEDEFGVLKIWVSKTLGLPVKYIGTDDNGWYSLELTEIQTGAPAESLFVVPPDVEMNN